MKLISRLTCFLAFTVVYVFAHAQQYPERAIRLIVPYTPAGTAHFPLRIRGSWVRVLPGAP